jgi:hypothetical protein
MQIDVRDQVRGARKRARRAGPAMPPFTPLPGTAPPSLAFCRTCLEDRL